MRAINATIMRHMNRTLILNQIRLRPISRAELAEETGLTRASVTQIVEELIGEGLVIETSIIGRTRLGRRSTQLAINPRSGAFVGVNLEADHCTVGVIDMHGKVLRQNTEIVTGRAPSEALKSISAIIDSQIARLEMGRARVRGIGMCAPSFLSDSTALSGWSGLPVSEMLAQSTGMPVRMETPANAQALEEKYFGRLGDTFLLLRAADTVSLAAVVDGSLYHGRGGFPVELGSCPMDMNGGAALNDLVSVPAQLEGAACRTADELIALCNSGAIPESVVERLAACITYAIHAFGIDVVAFAGPLAQSDALCDRLNIAVRRACRFPIASGPVYPCRKSDPVRLAAAPAYDSLFRTEADELLPR